MKNKTKDTKPIDTLFYSLFHDDALRCAITITTDTLKKAQEKHTLDPMATIALGRALSCASLLGSTLKKDQHYINCYFQGDGPLKNVTAEFIAPSALRGYVAVPQLAQVLKADDPIPNSVGEALGSKGNLQIKKGVQGNAEPYTGISELATGEIASDLARYLLDSEQIPSIVAAGVKLDKNGEVVASGGILIQKIGGKEVSEDKLELLEEKIEKELNLSDRIAAGESPESIFSYFTNTDIDTVESHTTPIGFRCFCSRDKMAMTLLSLGQKELAIIEKEVGKIEIRCHYCSTLHSFSLKELASH